MTTTAKTPLGNRLNYALETVQAWKEDVAEQKAGAILGALSGATDPDVGEYLFRLDALDVAETLIVEAMKKEDATMSKDPTTTPAPPADAVGDRIATLHGLLTDILADRSDPEAVDQAAEDAIGTLDDLAACLGGAQTTTDAAFRRARDVAVGESAIMRLRMVERMLDSTLAMAADVAEGVECDVNAADADGPAPNPTLSNLSVRAALLDTLIRRTRRELGALMAGEAE